MDIRRMNIWSFALITLSLLLASVGCSGPKGEAEQVLNDYVLAEGVGSKKAQLDVLAEADRTILEEEIEKRKKKGGIGKEVIADVVEEEIGGKFSVKVESAKVEGDKMTAEAEVTRPNEDELKSALLSKVFKVASEHKDSSEEEQTAAMAEAIRTALSENDFSTDTTNETFELRKEEGSWKVFRNLKAKKEVEDEIDAARDLSLDRKYDEAKKKAEAIKTKIDENGMKELQKDYARLQVSILRSEATQLKFDDKYGKAVANYEKMVELLGDAPEAGDKEKIEETLKELKEKKARKEAEDAYREKVSINNPHVKSQYGSKRVVGEVKNDGDKPLKKVTLAMKFLDKDGNEVHQKTRSVVYAGDDKEKAFKPGHSKKYSHYPHEAPDAWDGESVDVSVSVVEFFDEQ